MTLTFTILGCGFSGGVPRPALGWGACDPDNPKNSRRRCSFLVERHGKAGVTRVLVDTSPDLREQLYDAKVDWLDAVVYTHPHADHVHGIDDLRALALARRRRVDVYMDDPTAADVLMRFDYCFATPPGSDYPPILNRHRLVPGEMLTIDGQGGPIPVLPVLQEHGDIPSLGFRFGKVAYSADISGLPAASIPAMSHLDIWVVDALRYLPHKSHFCLDDALGWIERLKPRRAILSNLHSDLDYEVVRTQVPSHVVPAYDGLQFKGSSDL
jgi:phosphoribosyl 1,2-cyclic phosphate phosphodiesterase